VPIFFQAPQRQQRGYANLRDAMDGFKRILAERLAQENAGLADPSIAPATTNSPQSNDVLSPNGDMNLPGGDTVSANVERVRRARNAALINGALQGMGRTPINPALGALGGAAAGYLGTIGDWANKVWPGHEWDYKSKPGGNPDQGNYNYGATGSQLLPEWALLRGAGLAQMVFGPYNTENGYPWGGSPYGDNSDDGPPISRGFEYGRSQRWKKE